MQRAFGLSKIDLVQATCFIELFGGLRVLQGERLVERFQTQKTAALLGYLALNRERLVSRDVLAELLWPDGNSEAIKNRLNQAVSSLRRQLHAPGTETSTVIIGDRRSLGLAPDGIDVDVERFRMALGAAARSVGKRDEIRYLREAIDLYKGELLPEFEEPWVVAERLVLAEQYADALEKVITLLTRSGEPDQAIDFARKRLALDPNEVRANLELLELYYRADRMPSVIRHFEDFERRLLLLGVPVPDAAKVIEGRARKRAIAVTGGIAKTEPRRERVVRPARLPDPVRLTAPRSSTGFFGREGEVSDILDRLASGDRLTTVLGIGGSGKSRLVQEVGQRLSPRAIYVGLSAITDAKRIVPEILRLLGAAETGQEEPIVTLARLLEGRFDVLILDNLEQFGNAAGAEIGNLLSRIPQIRILAASRQPIGLGEERHMLLDPLPVPTPGMSLADLAANPAVTMLITRAQAVRPDFGLTERTAESINRLCQRLEGLPLAIELAASWARALTPGQILERLSGRIDALESRRQDIAPRHRTLRSAIAGTVELLLCDEQDYFARMFVFSGGWDREAAQAICPDARIDDFLDALAARALINVDHRDGYARYTMLTLLKSYATDLMKPEEIPTIRRRHAEFYRQRLQQIARLPSRWERFDDDELNYQAALETFEELREIEAALDFAAMLAPFWEARGRAKEAQRRLRRLLAAAPTDGDAGIRSRALAAIGNFAWLTGDYVEAKVCFLEALHGFLQQGDERRIIDTQFSLQMEAHRVGDYTQVRQLLRDNLKRAERLELYAAISRCWRAMGNVSMEEHRWEDARSEYLRSLEAARESGDEEMTAGALNNLANLAFLEGRVDAAREWLQDAITRVRRTGHRWHLAMSLVTLSKVESQAGNFEAARANLREVLGLASEEEIVLWRAVLQGAIVRVAEGEFEKSAQLFGYLDRFGLMLSDAKHPLELAPYEENLQRLRAALPAHKVDELWEVGRFRSLDEILGLL